MNKCRYVEDKVPPPAPSEEDMSNLHNEMQHRSWSGPVKDKLVVKDKKDSFEKVYPGKLFNR